MIVVRHQRAAQNRSRAQHDKEIACDRRNVDAEGLLTVANRLSPRIDTQRPSNLLERSRLVSKALEVLRGERQRAHAPAGFSPEHDDALLVENRQRATKHGVGYREHGNRQTDAARQNENDCSRGVQVAGQAPAAKPQILTGVVQPTHQSHPDIIDPPERQPVGICRGAPSPNVDERRGQGTAPASD